MVVRSAALRLDLLLLLFSLVAFDETISQTMMPVDLDYCCNVGKRKFSVETFVSHLNRSIKKSTAVLVLFCSNSAMHMVF